MANGKLTLKELPEKERPRERLLYHGETSLSNAELLAIVLGSGTKSESALQLAQRILKEAGDFQTLSNMSIRELREFNGIGLAKAAQLKASLELARRYTGRMEQKKPKFSNSRTVFEYFAPNFRGKQHEEFWVLVLDAKNKLLIEAIVSKGTLMASIVHPREIFQIAIKNAGASIIILHNHPSGDPDPSSEDRKVTQQIAEAGKLLAIPLLDHVIVGMNQYYSFKDSGLL
jgi:DNA repair protein RadC